MHYMRWCHAEQLCPTFGACRDVNATCHEGLGLSVNSRQLGSHIAVGQGGTTVAQLGGRAVAREVRSNDKAVGVGDRGAGGGGSSGDRWLSGGLSGREDCEELIDLIVES